MRRIDICETARRIISKAILHAIKDDIQDATWSLQLSARQIAGFEASIHFMRESFHSESTEAVLLVNTSNAFNALNRDAAFIISVADLGFYKGGSMSRAQVLKPHPV